MPHRPYFKHGIEQLQALVATSRSDLNVLRAIQYELSFRTRPKARTLKGEVDDLVRQLLGEDQIPLSGPETLAITPNAVYPRQRDAESLGPPQAITARVIVECANCKTPNFVSTLDGVVQHLSCSACKLPYEAQFKYGVMRTTFQVGPVAESSGSSLKWIIIGVAFLIILALIAK